MKRYEKSIIRIFGFSIIFCIGLIFVFHCSIKYYRTNIKIANLKVENFNLRQQLEESEYRERRLKALLTDSIMLSSNSIDSYSNFMNLVSDELDIKMPNFKIPKLEIKDKQDVGGD